MMMLYRLVRLIETHSQSLSPSLLDQVQGSERTRTYQKNVRVEELKERVYEIYRHLGEWLVGKDESHLEQRYLQIGARRACQRVPMSEMTWVIVLTKENLLEFVKKESVEMLQLLEQLFDRAIYYATVGYELEIADEVLRETSAPSRSA
jgi:hypothetical protein